MTFFDFLAMAVVAGGLLGFIQILSKTYLRRLEHKVHLAELKAGSGLAAPLPAPEHEAKVERLEHRLRVLERIATDKTANLAAQIEDLREPSN